MHGLERYRCRQTALIGNWIIGRVSVAIHTTEISYQLHIAASIRTISAELSFHNLLCDDVVPPLIQIVN